MATKSKAKKVIKKPKNQPNTLSAGDAIRIEQLSSKLHLLRKGTELHKARLDIEVLRLKAFQQEVLIQQNKIDTAKRNLKLHGEEVMNAEQKSQRFSESLCEKYGVAALSYDDQTLEIVEGS